jgi:hypothetical protein
MSICNVVQTIQPTQCIGDSLPVINNNFNNLNNSVCTLDTRTTEISGKISAGITEYYNESTFIYSANTGGLITPGLSNQWQNVYTNPLQAPLRVVVPQSPIARKAFITGFLYVRKKGNTFATYWSRLARFATSNVLDTIPLFGEVLSVSCNEAGASNASFGLPCYFNSGYNLLPNTEYIFGLQTYFLSTPSKASERWMEVNGFHNSGTSLPFQGNGPRNTNPSTYQPIFATTMTPPPGQFGILLPSNPLVPSSTPAYLNDPSIKCASYIKVTIL